MIENRLYIINLMGNFLWPRVTHNNYPDISLLSKIKRLSHIHVDIWISTLNLEERKPVWRTCFLGRHALSFNAFEINSKTKDAVGISTGELHLNFIESMILQCDPETIDHTQIHMLNICCKKRRMDAATNQFEWCGQWVKWT